MSLWSKVVVNIYTCGLHSQIHGSVGRLAFSDLPARTPSRSDAWSALGPRMLAIHGDESVVCSDSFIPSGCWGALKVPNSPTNIERLQK
jgi:hypothetical protein